MAEIFDATKKGDEFHFFECLIHSEAQRRGEEAPSIPLEHFEQHYFGIEVGHIRRTFNKAMLRYMKTGGDLLDYGCGGEWFKNEYWHLFGSVCGAEVDLKALKSLSLLFPQATLLHTRNGLLDIDKNFDVVLSSSVVGYILPVQADRHLESCYQLLKPGGQLVLTRVKAFGLADVVKSRRLSTVHGTSFTYSYSKKELMSSLERIGFKNIRYHNLGIMFPLIGMKRNQELYRRFPGLMSKVFPVIIPFLKIQHFITADK